MSRPGRPDLHFHDLRHTAATFAVASGATTAELMHRAGHSNHVAALRYQHATQDRDRVIAEALGQLAETACRCQSRGLLADLAAWRTETCPRNGLFSRYFSLTLTPFSEPAVIRAWSGLVLQCRSSNSTGGT